MHVGVLELSADFGVFMCFYKNEKCKEQCYEFLFHYGRKNLTSTHKNIKSHEDHIV